MIRRGGVVTSTLLCGSLIVGAASCDYEPAYAGWYVGVGAGYQYTKGEVQLDDNLKSEVLPGVLGAVDAHGFSLAKSNVGKVGAVLAVGYGDTFGGNYYVGGEVSLDVAGSKSRTRYSGVPYESDTVLKTRGIIPTVALRLGGFVPAIDCLAYAKLGFTFLNNKFKNNQGFPGQDFGSQKITPIVGIGLEKMIGDGCSLKIDADYRFPANKKKSGLMLYGDGQPLNAGYNGTVNNKVRGYVVRVMCVYHF